MKNTYLAERVACIPRGAADWPLRAWLLAACITLVQFAWPGTARAAQDWHADNEITGGVATTPDNTYLSTINGAVHSSWANATVTVDASHTLTVGRDSNGNGKPLTLSTDTIILNVGSTGLNVDRSGEGGSTTLTLKTLEINGGVVKVLDGASASAKNTLEFGGIAGTGSIELEVGTSATVKYTGGGRLIVPVTRTFSLTMGNIGSGSAALAVFANGLTVNSGSILAESGGGRLVAGSGTEGFVLGQGTLGADGGKLEIAVSERNGQMANVVLGRSGAVDLDILNDGAIHVNNLTIEGATAMDASGSGSLSVAGDLTVEANFDDAADVDTTVAGATVIDNAVYTVSGTGNVYTGGIQVKNGGELWSDANDTTITVGGVRNGGVVLSDGTLASGGGIFTVDTREVSVTGGGGVLDATAGALDLSTALLRVAGDTDIYADNGVTVAAYSQTAGVVDITGGSGGDDRFIVLGAAAMGGTGATEMNVFGDSVWLQAGMTMGGGSVLAAGGAQGVVGVGVGAKTATLALTGDAELNGTAGTLVIESESARPSAVNFSGFDNRAVGEIDARTTNATVGSSDVLKPALTISGGGTHGFLANSFTVAQGEAAIGQNGILSTVENVLVRSGGVLASEHDAALMDGSLGGTNNRISIMQGGTLTTRHGNLETAGYGVIDIAGSFIAGVSAANIGQDAAILKSDGNINLTRTASVGVTDELALLAKEGDVLMETTGAIASRATLSDFSMFGLYGYSITADKKQLIIDYIKNRISGDYTEEDLAVALGNLREIWGKDQIGKDLGEIIYNASVIDPGTGEYGIVADPEDSVPGNKNIDILQALASPRGKSVSRNTLEMVNGAHNFGVAEVAISTTQSMLQNINQRTRAVGAQLMAAADAEAVGSSDALATQVLNQLYDKRFWVGGFHSWDETEGHDDFSGHEYKSNGFIMGYDQVMNCYTVVGGAFAYTKGDYEDKGAISNDSEISSYSFSAYGTYALPIGFYAAGALAFTHSKNNIRAMRHDPSIGGASWAEADFNGSTFAAGMTIGYDYRPTDAFALSPSVGLNYLYHTMSDHDVRFGGVATQRESDLSHDALLLPVEIRGHYDLLRGEKCAVRFEANAGYTYNFNTDPMDGTILYNGIIWNNSGKSVSSSLRSREAEKHTYHLGAGVRYYYEKFDLGLKYDFIGSTNRTAHNILASAGVVF